MATATPMTLQSAADLIDLSIQKIQKKQTNLELEVAKDLYNQTTTSDYYEKDSSLSGFGEASRMTENAIIISETPVQGYDKTYTQVFFGNMASFSKYEWKFGISKRKLESVAADLPKSVIRKRERLLTEYLENSTGSTTSYTAQDGAGNYSKTVTGGDSLALINSAHTREDGGSTWSNVISDGTTSNMDFAPDALRAAYRTASLIRDPKGNLMNINPEVFVCRKGSSIYFDAMEINGALKKNFKPQSADKDGAPFGAFDVVALPYLSTTAQAYWWMFDRSLKGPSYGLQYFESQPVMTDKPDTDYKTKTIYITAHAAFDYGHNDGRNWQASTGTNAA